MSPRQWFYSQFDQEHYSGRGLSPLNRLIMSVILFSILTAILESEPVIKLKIPDVFIMLNYLLAIVFSIEYGLRVWAMGLHPNYQGLAGNVRYMLRVTSLIDLLATVVIWVGLFTPLEGVYGVMLRLVRVLRAINLARNSEWAVAFILLKDAILKRSNELILSMGFAGIILVISSTVLFFAEGQVQPDAFGSIPRAMWWAIATLTTIGYGDVYPITVVGKIFASLVAITSIAIVAMPTGIMAAAFSDAFQELKNKED